MIAEFVKSQIAGSGFISLVARAEHAAGQALVRAGRKSAVVTAVGPLFAKADLFRAKRESSVLCALAARLWSLLLTVVRAVYTGVSRVPGLRFLTTAADALLKLRLCDVCAFVTALMLCVYHDRWSNGYMLIAAVVLAALYLIRAFRSENRAARLPVSLYLFLLSAAALVPFTGVFTENLRMCVH